MPFSLDLDFLPEPSKGDEWCLLSFENHLLPVKIESDEVYDQFGDKINNWMSKRALPANSVWQSSTIHPIDKRIVLGKLSDASFSLVRVDKGELKAINPYNNKVLESTLSVESWCDVGRQVYSKDYREKCISGIVRFSVLSDQRNHFKQSDSLSFQAYSEKILDKYRLDRRFLLFENITLPSLESQQLQNFLIYVIAPRLLPEDYKSRLQSLALKYNFLRIVYASERNFAMKDVSDKVLSEINCDEAFATFRLDDDDALKFDFTARLTRYIKARYQKMAVSLSSGYVVDVRSEDKVGIKPFLHTNASAGLAVIGGPRFKKTIFDVTEKHIRMHLRLPVINDGRQPAFALTTHHFNDTGDRRKSDVTAFSKIFAEAELKSVGFFTELSKL